jgi:hypothetical protein
LNRCAPSSDDEGAFFDGYPWRQELQAVAYCCQLIVEG